MPLLTLPQIVGPGNRTQVEAAIRARCHTLLLDEARVLCRVLGRYKFLVDRTDLGLSVHLMLDGYWEFWCTDFILRHVQPGQVVFDVGANLGYYAVMMGEAVGPGGEVHAIEPNPRLAALVEQNLALNGTTGVTRLHRAAAYSASGVPLRFVEPQGDPKNGHVLQPETGAQPGEYAVSSLRLDDVTDRPVHFLKVDVEGAEEEVWAGMQRMLDRSPEVILLLEFNALRCRAPAELLADMARRFPLRELNLHAQVLPVVAEALLDRREDTLLVLTNRPALAPPRTK